MARPRQVPAGAAQSPPAGLRPEFVSEAPPSPRRAALGDPVAYDRVGRAAHYERAAEAVDTPDEEQPRHSLGGGKVLTDRVTKFDARTGGMPLTFPAGTPVSDLPEWLAKDVLDNPALVAEG